MPPVTLDELMAEAETQPSFLALVFSVAASCVRTPGRGEPRKYHPDNKSRYAVFTCRQELGIISRGRTISVQFTARVTALECKAPRRPFNRRAAESRGVRGSTDDRWFLPRDDVHFACVPQCAGGRKCSVNSGHNDLQRSCHNTNCKVKKDTADTGTRLSAHTRQLYGAP